jgi:hypothetical protein
MLKIMSTAIEDDGRLDEATLERIWSNLPTHVCERHRRQARNVRPTADDPKPTDWKIEERPRNISVPSRWYYRRCVDFVYTWFVFTQVK